MYVLPNAQPCFHIMTTAQGQMAETWGATFPPQPDSWILQELMKPKSFHFMR